MRFVLDDEPETVTALTQSSGLANAGIEDGVQGVIRFRSGLIAQFYDAFTTGYAVTGFEVHGSDGSLIATNCMTQRPIGDVLLRTAAGDEQLPLDHENLYVRGLRTFHGAMRGEGQPAATGEDGVRSLAVGIAALQSAASGRAVAIEPGI